MALIAGLALVEVLLPAYGSFMGRPLELHYLADWPLTLAIVGIGILAGLVSGFYPALVLSGFRPAATLRANTSSQSGSGRLRNALVMLQFAVSIGLGIGALVVFQQIQFARNIDLGFRRDNIVFTGTGGRLTEDGIKSFMQALERGPGVLQVARTSFMPFFGNNRCCRCQRPGDAQFLSPNHISVSEDYFQLFGIKLLAGRALQDNREEDQFLRRPESATRARMTAITSWSMPRWRARLASSPTTSWARRLSLGKSQVRVVGVVADTLSEGDALAGDCRRCMSTGCDNLQNIVIRVAPGRLPEAMDYVARTQRQLRPRRRTVANLAE